MYSTGLHVPTHPEFDCNGKDDKDGSNRAERGAAKDPRIQARTSNAAQCARQTKEREIGTGARQPTITASPTGDTRLCYSSILQWGARFVTLLV